MNGLRGGSVRFQLIVNLLLISVFTLAIAFTLLYFLSPLFAEPHFSSVETLAAVFGLTLIIILFVALWMEKRFSVPLEQLLGALKSLASDGDYTLRLKPKQRSGFGKLYEGINDLLEAIQRRDASISAYSSDMSRLVEARTSQLSREHVELEKKIQDFARAKSSAEASNRAKSRFLADATHEIRAPMNGMLGMTELLLGTQLDEKQFHYANTIRNSGGTLLNIVNDLLDFSKIEAGRLDLEAVDFDLRPLVAETCELFKKSAHRKGLSLEYELDEDVPSGMQGDPTRLRQVLTNLLGNAIKFTESGEVRLTVSRLGHGVQAIPLCFQVTDTGIGIPEERQSEIFSAFTQADGSTSRYFGGTGLGLSISQQLSQLMGGCITVESEPGCGSTFRFAAGFAAPSESWESEQKSAAKTDATAESVTLPVFAARVLLAEDNPVNQEVTEAMLLQRINYILGSAEILEKLRQNERSLAHALEELRRKRDEALSAVKARGEFLANMSHEIRTPMNGVMGMLALLEDADLEGKERDYLDTARRSADSLLHIINDILDFSKIEAEKLTLECVDFDLGRLVEETASLFVESANSKDLELNCYIANSISGIFSGDPTRIRQVLSNLVSNAVKFTNRGGVFLKVELQEEHGGKQWIRFTVEDTGIGVQEGDQAHLFEPFTQGDGSVTRKYGGTGLGLSISKELVRMMGGELGMTSRVGRGSSFFFHLPLMHVSKAEPFRIVSGSDLLEHWVMIAGGSATSRFVLETYLKTDPFLKLSTCASYSQAMQVLHENAVQGTQKYQLLLLDCDAIETGGREYVERLKDDPATKDLKIVPLLQGGRSVCDYDVAEVDGVLAKPVRKGQLFEMLSNLFNNRDNNKMLQQKREGKREQQILPRFQGSVLVVDDEPMNLMVAVGILEKLGISPDNAKNGQQAIEKSRMVEYDLILMDCQMPGMSGYEVTGMIRNREALSGGNRTPIIAMTANAMEGAKEEAIQHGMDDYISKPFQPSELASLLSSWLLPAQDEVDSPGQAEIDGDLIEGAEQRPVVWDRVAALKTIDGDEKLLGQMIEMFVERVPVTLGHIISAMDEDDAAVMAGSAHALKGLVSHFSAYRARDLAAELEKRAKRGELAGVDELVRSLRLEVETLVANLDEAR
ncbi:MAG: hypothetical protein DIZ78_10510 [endosymbiont of Escarpia spicata]|uniref:Sensory/regulatory protein RpfC n=1 Tax=endosymbiont of Escarpia spicata TaxID=2200908 RepID=A0A370DKF9_9GAMM|nr:MAG: hypothetical protein DIZ78_10510 [endosymbiont of Escarpia spicata]